MLSNDYDLGHIPGTVRGPEDANSKMNPLRVADAYNTVGDSRTLHREDWS